MLKHTSLFLLFNQDSNLDKQDQNLLCCHYTIEQTYPLHEAPKVGIYFLPARGSGKFFRKKRAARRMPGCFSVSLGWRVPYLVAFSSRFIIMKMKRAEIRQRTMRMDHNAHNSILPHSMPMTDTR